MIVLTGANGVLGSAVRACLAQQGTPFEVAARADVDLADTAATHDYFRRHRPEIVIHCAARVHGLMGNRRFPAEMFDENMAINTNVVSAARQAGARRLVVASTVAAYPGHLVDNIREDQLFDGPPHVGENAYAHAKRAMLAQLEAYAKQYEIGFAYLVFTNLYGPNDRFDVDNGHVVPSLVAKFYHAARNGGPVEVWGRGRARRDFLYADDAAAAMVHATHHGDGAINVATGTTVPIAQVVEILSQVSGVSDVVWDHDKPEGQLDRSYDVTRLREMGFRHRHDLESGLRQTYDWYAGHYPDVRS